MNAAELLLLPSLDFVDGVRKVRKTWFPSRKIREKEKFLKFGKSGFSFHIFTAQILRISFFLEVTKGESFFYFFHQSQKKR
jgi:hypothetical protein